MGVVSTVVGLPAEASGYRYWNYWQTFASGGTMTWRFAAAGPYFTTPKADQWVEGWRFETSDPFGPLPPPPRASAKYSDLCHDAVVPGKYRIAIVVDFGILTDVPAGDVLPLPNRMVICRLISPGTNSFAALQDSGIELRANPSSYICGIHGYPRTECAGVGSGTPSPPPPIPSVPGNSAGAPTPNGSLSSSPLSSVSPAASLSPLAPTPTPTESASVAPTPFRPTPNASRIQPFSAILAILALAALGYAARRRYRAGRDV